MTDTDLPFAIPAAIITIVMVAYGISINEGIAWVLLSPLIFIAMFYISMIVSVIYLVAIEVLCLPFKILAALLTGKR